MKYQHSLYCFSFIGIRLLDDANFELAFVVLHSIRLAHTDLKPENMLFVDSGYDVYWNEHLVIVFFIFLACC